MNIRANAYYRLNGQTLNTPSSPLNELLAALAGSIQGVTGGKFGMQQVQSSGVLGPGVSDLLQRQTDQYSGNTRPKAFLNWILLDEQFKIVNSSTGFEPVGADGEFKTFVKTGLPISQNGYLYVYTSNESPVDVFFDNLQVTHVRGPLLEETHYYPFGLTLNGISSKASSFGQPGNKYKYNGIEFDEDLGINSYEAFYRELDPSTGRWWQVDPKIEMNMESWSPYASNFDNPIRFNDPKGDCPTCKEIWKDIKDALKETANSAYNGAVDAARAFNRFNPIANVVEIATGKSVQSDFSVAKPRAQSVADLGVNSVLMFGAEAVNLFRASAISAEVSLAGNALKGGEWVTTNESMSQASAKFQSSVTGESANQSFLLNGVKFDGVQGNTLLEAKSGMSNFVNSKTGQFQSWFKGSQGLVDQATRQVEAAGGANIQWVFENKSVMQATQTLFKNNNVKGIDFVLKTQ